MSKTTWPAMQLDEILTYIRKHNGITLEASRAFNRRVGYNKGFMVGSNQLASQLVETTPGDDFVTVEALGRALEVATEQAIEVGIKNDDAEFYVGVWDVTVGEGEKFVVDVSFYVEDIVEALMLGSLNHQDAIYSWADDEDIRL